MARFAEKRYRLANARQNWKNLVNKYKLKKKKRNLFEVIQIIKNYIFLKKLTQPIRRFARKSFLDKVKDNQKKTIIYGVLVQLLPKTNQKRNIL